MQTAQMLIQQMQMLKIQLLLKTQTARTQLQMILPQIQKKPLMIKNQQTILHPQMTQRQKVQILLPTIGHDSHNVCVVGDNAADMMAAVEAVGQGGHVLVRDGEVVARIPLALGGLMSEGTAEDVAAQHDDFMVKARAMGIEPPLDPIMGIIFLPLPVIPTLRIRPEGMFDVTTFTYAD